MGSKKYKETRPVHSVSVKTFWIMKTEVTYKQYLACANSGGCIPFFAKTVYDARNHKVKSPMDSVSIREARLFCRWVGGRLPSESEWEFAARSRGKNWKYPWGNSRPTCAKVNMRRKSPYFSRFCGSFAVCHTQTGNTVQGLCDMNGSVSEFVGDCWHVNYEGKPNDGSSWKTNCRNSEYVIRGGNRMVFQMDYADYDMSRRWGQIGRSMTTGFRCVRTASP